MRRKITPYIFLSFLALFLVFLLGVRYGRHVELVNKNIQFLISIPPSPPHEPTSRPLEFVSYSHKGCAISFLMPNTLEKIKESTYSAVFAEHIKQNKQMALSLTCSFKNEITPPISLPSPIKLQNTFVYPQLVNDMAILEFHHPLRSLYFSLSIKKNLLPLLQKSILFE